MVVGCAALSGRLRGFKLVPIKWRCPVPPTSTPQGHTHRVLRKRNPLGALSYEIRYQELSNSHEDDDQSL
jgi:hypothetical protein